MAGQHRARHPIAAHLGCLVGGCLAWLGRRLGARTVSQSLGRPVFTRQCIGGHFGRHGGLDAGFVGWFAIARRGFDGCAMGLAFGPHGLCVCGCVVGGFADAVVGQRCSAHAALAAGRCGGRRGAGGHHILDVGAAPANLPGHAIVHIRVHRHVEQRFLQFDGRVLVAVLAVGVAAQPSVGWPELG